MNSRVLFGGLIAIILLALYVYLIMKAIAVAQTCAPDGPTKCADAFTSNMTSALTILSGLVSSLVIAELAVTPPGSAPVARFVDPNLNPMTHKATAIVSTIYVMVWLVAGLAAFLIGYLQHPDVVKTLTDLGSAWLGLVVAAAYSWLGIRPPTP